MAKMDTAEYTQKLAKPGRTVLDPTKNAITSVNVVTKTFKHF